jgi:hypothetical protein
VLDAMRIASTETEAETVEENADGEIVEEADLPQ